MALADFCSAIDGAGRWVWGRSSPALTCNAQTWMCQAATDNALYGGEGAVSFTVWFRQRRGVLADHAGIKRGANPTDIIEADADSSLFLDLHDRLPGAAS